MGSVEEEEEEEAEAAVGAYGRGGVAASMPAAAVMAALSECDEPRLSSTDVGDAEPTAAAAALLTAVLVVGPAARDVFE